MRGERRNRIAAALLAAGVSGDTERSTETITPPKEPPVPAVVSPYEATKVNKEAREAIAPDIGTETDAQEEREKEEAMEKALMSILRILKLVFPDLKVFDRKTGTDDINIFFQSLKKGDLYVVLLPSNNIGVSRFVDGPHSIEVMDREAEGGKRKMQVPMHTEPILDIDIELDEETRYVVNSGARLPNPDPELTMRALADQAAVDQAAARQRPSGSYLSEEHGEDGLEDSVRRVARFQELYDQAMGQLPPADTREEKIANLQTKMRAMDQFVEYCDTLDPATGQPQHYLDAVARAAIRQNREIYQDWLRRLEEEDHE